jgi:6-phosphofructokinase 2
MRELLADEGITATTVAIEGETRQSISITEESTGDQYRFVLPGPHLTDTDIAACLSAVVERAHQPGRTAASVVVSGSMPAGTPPDFLSSLVTALGDTRLIVDTSGPALGQAVQSGCYLVKPSARELAKLVDRKLTTEVDVVEAAVEVQRTGSVGSVLASIGAGGAILVDDAGTTRLRAPTVAVRSTVGAGDSLVAGVVVGLHRGCSLVEAVALGVATGTAAVMTDGTELARIDDVNLLHRAVVIDG